LYRTEPVAATLPLDFPVWVEPLPAPRLEPLGAGLAGGVVAVRLGDLAVVEGVAGPVLVPGSGDRCVMRGLVDGELVAWCQVTAVAPVVLDRDGRLAAEGWLPEHVRLGGVGGAPWRRCGRTGHRADADRIPGCRTGAGVCPGWRGVGGR
jgi:hypothetical protein